MGDHNYKGPLSKRPLIEEHSGIEPLKKKEQKIIETTTGESGLIITKHLDEGWYFHSQHYLGGNECRIVFER